MQRATMQARRPLSSIAVTQHLDDLVYVGSDQVALATVSGTTSLERARPRLGHRRRGHAVDCHSVPLGEGLPTVPRRSRRALADACQGRILKRNSEAMNPGARCRAD